MFLPLPFKNFIPKMFRDYMDDSMQAMVDRAENHIEEWRNSIKELAYLKHPERCPSLFLGELDNYLNAGFKQYDSDFTKRSKIEGAIEGHKRRGTWEDDAKIKIDAVTGYSARIFGLSDSDDAIELGKESSDPDKYWMTEQANDGSDDELGVWEVGEMTEGVISGIINIDCHETIHTSTLTADEIAQIILEIEDDIVPAYYRVYLGYTDTSDNFVKYAGGQIH